ncbi:MAG: signal peptidase I [Coriobacteriia bacterium]|nr:signal peptidase I [Coriobacteriia bacterium]
MTHHAASTILIDAIPPTPEVVETYSVGQELKALAFKTIAIIVSALLLFTFVYGLHYNVEPGMYPSIKDGDLVMYSRWSKDYRAGDLLMLRTQGKTHVRRVVAIAGDTVDITEQGLVINGSLQQEPDIKQETNRYAEGVDFPLTISEGEVFVLGDARDGATDSRIYGAAKEGDTEGTVISVLRRRNL